MPAFPIAAMANIASGVIDRGLNVWGRGARERREDNKIQRITADAKKAGIHPLAALGSPASGYKAAQGMQGSSIGEGLSRAAQSLMRTKSQEEINALRASTNANQAQAELFRAQSRTILSRAAGAVRGGPPVDYQPRELRMYGAKVKRDPKAFSRAQQVQDEYGDVVENIIGIPSFMWSAAGAYGKWERRQRKALMDYFRGKGKSHTPPGPTVP